jgi:hypothetical protein
MSPDAAAKSSRATGEEMSCKKRIAGSDALQYDGLEREERLWRLYFKIPKWMWRFDRQSF